MEKTEKLWKLLTNNLWNISFCNIADPGIDFNLCIALLKDSNFT